MMKYLVLFLFPFILLALEQEIVEKKVETDHELLLKGVKIPYRAEAGTIVLKNNKNEPEAEIFYVSYTKKEEVASERPLIFFFNGGPGAASVWLHLGGFGPRRIKVTESGEPLFPYQLTDNPYTLLEYGDLVFVDTPCTGLSRIVSGVDEKSFLTMKGDVKALTEFIRLYVTKEGRWSSPKFLVGESYGGVRVTLLAKELLQSCFMTIDGIVLISGVLDFQTIDFVEGNDLPFMTFLPAMSAVSWYHEKILKDKFTSLDDLLEKSAQFAMNEYATSLLKGALTKVEEEEIAEKLSLYTGVEKEKFIEHNLRLDSNSYRKNLLTASGEMVGRFDGRFLAFDPAPTSRYARFDPTVEALAPLFTALMNTYLRKELNWQTVNEYEVLVNLPSWDYQSDNCYVNLNSTLREVMCREPRLKVFAACGLYDLAASYYSCTYTLNHLYLPSELQKNVATHLYKSGHMIYISESSLKELSAEMALFLLTR